MFPNFKTRDEVFDEGLDYDESEHKLTDQNLNLGTLDTIVKNIFRKAQEEKVRKAEEKRKRLEQEQREKALKKDQENKRTIDLGQLYGGIDNFEAVQLDAEYDRHSRFMQGLIDNTEKMVDAEAEQKE